MDPSPRSPRLGRRLLGHSIVALLRLIPRAHRFGAMLRLAGLAAPVVERFSIIESEFTHLDTAHELAFYRLLEFVTRYGLEFDVDVTIEGREHFDAVCSDAHPSLLTGLHTMLSLLFIPLVRGKKNFCLVAADSRLAVVGAAEVMPSVVPNGLLLRARSCFRERGTVAAMVDTPPMSAGVAAGTFDPSLFALAIRCSARVFFFVTRIRDGRVVMHFINATGTTADEINAQFVAFTRANSRATRERETGDAFPTPQTAGRT